MLDLDLEKFFDRVLPPLAALLRARPKCRFARALGPVQSGGHLGSLWEGALATVTPFDPETVKSAGRGWLLASFPESLIDEDLHIHATVQGAPLSVGILGSGMSGTVARGGNDPSHGNISLLE